MTIGDNDCGVESKEASIPSIDERLSGLNGRLTSALSHMKSASHGEEPVCESDEKSSIPSPSLDSITSRLEDAHKTMGFLENYISKFHS